MPSITHKLDLGSIGEHDVDVLYEIWDEYGHDHAVITKVELVIQTGIQLVKISVS